MLKPRSFDVCRNTAIPMIGHLEVDIEVSDTGMETTESNDCKKILINDRDANEVLAMIQRGARFSYKNRWKFINLFTQSISRLYWVSQLYPRIKE